MHLVEVLAIGEEVGAEAYLFGSISAAWVTADRVVVADAQVPAVRVFDRAGHHLFDVGRTGQGPGEFSSPAGLVVTHDGRIAVADVMNTRINFYDTQGEFVEDWPLPGPKSALGLWLTNDGELLTEGWDLESGRMGMLPIGPDGPRGEYMFPPDIGAMRGSLPIGNGAEVVLPFAPGYVWTPTPGGELVAGIGETYRLRIVREDGRVDVLERQSPATPVSRAEAEYRAAAATAGLAFTKPGVTISAANLPENKPYFTDLFADRAGRLWVVRPGPGRPDVTCDELPRFSTPQLTMPTGTGTYYESGGKPGPVDETLFEGRCLTDTVMFDLFDLATGRFSGTIDPPEPGFGAPLFADREIVAAAVVDAAGTVRLKLYSLERD